MKHTSSHHEADLLPRAQPLFPAEGGTLLRKLAPEILQRWEDRVREAIPCARHQDRLLLFDEIPLFLARVAQTLTGELALRGDEVCREHGEQDVQHGHLLESDRLKDEFVATLAHELRTPLSAVANATYILENIHLDERALRQLNIVNRQVSNLNRLVQDIMDVSRITQNKLEIRREPVDFGRLAHDACESVRPNCDARGQDLVCNVPDEPIVLQGDAVRLEQVVTNLLNNATNFTPAGGNIWMDLAREESEAVLRVRDSGVGIPAVMLPQIFDLFAQVEAKGAGRSGLGIGLALVKRLVAMHGGSVAAHSAGEGCGTEFVVRLPCLS
ncbi:MAG: HAMP domain-containing histidine kinase [Chloroflexi bacterium]|nr:HAMP domain-containing histidine kinase [Chloroflexota bacterium]